MYYDGVTCKSKVGRSVPKTNFITESLTTSEFHQHYKTLKIAFIYRI